MISFIIFKVFGRHSAEAATAARFPIFQYRQIPHVVHGSVTFNVPYCGADIVLFLYRHEMSIARSKILMGQVHIFKLRNGTRSLVFCIKVICLMQILKDNIYASGNN